MPDSAAKLADTLPFGVLLLDSNLRVRGWNSWLVQKTGITVEQASNKTLEQLFPDFRSPRLLTAITQCIKYNSPQIISQTLNRYVLPIPLTLQIHDLTMMQQQVSVSPLQHSTDETLAVVSINDVTESIAKSSALARLAQKLELQSNRDQLTGAYNRRYLWTWLTTQLHQSVRHGHALSCLMLDIDHFKLINDTYGHDVGDKVLQGFSNILKKQLRDSDLLVRYGGEEFLILLPYAEARDAMETANRIIDSLRESTIEPLGTHAVRCSIGVSSWTAGDPCSADELLKKADRNLYLAKVGGRDQAVMQHMPPHGAQ